MSYVATVIVEKTAFHFDRPFDYLLAESQFERVKVGCRVAVPFGNANRKLTAIVISLRKAEQADYSKKLKSVAYILDKEPELNEEMVALAEWMKEHIFCTYYDAFKPMLPTGVHMKMVASYTATEKVDLSVIADLPQDEQKIVHSLFISKQPIERDDLIKKLEIEDAKILDILCKKGLIKRLDEAVRNMADATIKMVRLSDNEINFHLTEKQSAVFDFVEQVGSASVKEVCYFVGCTQGVVTTLIKKGVLTSYESTVYRTPKDLGDIKIDKSEIVLTQKQTEAYEKLSQIYSSGEGGASLLYGVTGSGKTKVFMRLVDDAFKEGKGTIVMVPEISLTPQTLNLFYSRYGSSVAVFHSAMSVGQRMDEWRRVKKGEALVAIGTRSAVFAPFDNLGLIIIDEEQEHTYKSEASPRFHARDIARFRCAYNKGLLVLSSATPSIETYALAKSGRYTLTTLPERYGNALLPRVTTVDMRSELKGGNKSVFSNLLIERLAENLENKKQSILLLNRRGHNTLVSCSGCGEVKSCPNCSISLTYHSANKRLMCHYCGYSEPFMNRCTSCGSEHIKYSGAGTQKAEEELKLLFPTARILRMDADSTMTKNAHEQKLSAFKNKEYDIMLGTQMVAKGLDFPDVTLVGVLNADSTLYSEDFRAFERTFSLLTQVIGRAGRGDTGGEAIIQTITPENEIISLASAQDYDGFYESEILTRKAMVYPPFCSICTIGFIGISSGMARQGAEEVLEHLRRLNEEHPSVKMIVLGPNPAMVSQVAGKFRYRLTIKAKNSAQFRGMVRKALEDFGKSKTARVVSAFADMNPENVF